MNRHLSQDPKTEQKGGTYLSDKEETRGHPEREGRGECEKDPGVCGRRGQNRNQVAQACAVFTGKRIQRARREVNPQEAFLVALREGDVDNAWRERARRKLR